MRPVAVGASFLGVHGRRWRPSLVADPAALTNADGAFIWSVLHPILEADLRHDIEEFASVEAERIDVRQERARLFPEWFGVHP